MIVATVKERRNMDSKIVCERRMDEGLRVFKDGTIGTIRTIESGGDKRVIESYCMSGNNYNQRQVVHEPNAVSRTLIGQGGHAGNEPKVIDKQYDYRIRKLTPLECWRLMGFSDEDYYAAKTGSRATARDLMAAHPNGGAELEAAADKEQNVSNTQLYKQAGNSIVVDVLYYIYKNLYQAMPYLFDNLKVGSYFSGIGAFERGLDKMYANIAVEGHRHERRA